MALKEGESPFKNLRDKLATIRREITHIEKSGTAPQAAGGYKYMRAEDICGEIGDQMALMGITMAPIKVQVIAHDVLTVTRSDGSTRRDLHVLLVVTYRFLDSDSAEFIDVEAPGEGIDQSDKASNKAMTGAKKYALSQALTLRIGEDSEAADTPDKRTPASAATNGAAHAPASPVTTSGGAAPYTPPRASGPTISDAQGKRLYAIAKGNRDLLHAVCEPYGYVQSKEILRSHYDAICTEVEKRINAPEPVIEEEDISF